jgi:short-subunit dehydrogenase
VTLAGRAALVTGASSGIGEATALALAAAGARVGLLARRRERLETVAHAIAQAGGDALVLAGDVTDETFARAAVGRVLDRWSRLDVVVNNAGRGLAARFEDTTTDDLRAILELNLVSVLTVTRAALPAMRRQGRGHIINVSSVVGRRGIPLRAAYSATKFALGGLTEALRVELRGTGIHATLVYPVYTETEFHRVEPRRTETPLRAGPVQSAEHVARAIVRCARWPRPEVYPYWPSRILALLSVVAPGAVDALLARLQRRTTR